MKTIIIILLTSIKLCAQIPSYTDVQIEMAGQSNCAGKATGAISAYTPLNSSCKIFNTSTYLFETINAQTNTGQPTTNGQGAYGVETPLAYKINLLTKKKVFINKYGIDNTGITSFMERSSLYLFPSIGNTMIYNTDKSNPYLTNTTKRLGFIWIQGEADGTTTTNANAYLANLRILVSDWRLTRKLKGPIIFVTPSYNPSLVPYRNTVVAAMNTVASENTDIYVIDTVSQPLGDGLHYTGTAIESIATSIFNILKGYL